MKNNPLELAINKYKKGVNKRNLKLWCNQVVSDIEDQIQIKKDKIKGLNRDLVQRKEEAEHDLVDRLLNVDENQMSSLDARKTYSQQYMLGAIQAISNFESNIDTLESQIKEENEKLETLQSLITKFTEVNESVEEVVETEE